MFIPKRSKIKHQKILNYILLYKWTAKLCRWHLIDEKPATNELIFQKKWILPNMDSVILGKRCHLLAVFGVKSGSVLFEKIWASCFQRYLPGSSCTANSGQSSSVRNVFQKIVFEEHDNNNTLQTCNIYITKFAKCFLTLQNIDQLGTSRVQCAVKTAGNQRHSPALRPGPFQVLVVQTLIRL